MIVTPDFKKFFRRLFGHKKKIFEKKKEDFAQWVARSEADDCMAYLALFCHIHETTYFGNPQEMAIREGRRQVYLYIKNCSALDAEKEAYLYTNSLMKRKQLDEYNRFSQLPKEEGFSQ